MDPQPLYLKYLGGLIVVVLVVVAGVWIVLAAQAPPEGAFKLPSGTRLATIQAATAKGPTGLKFIFAAPLSEEAHLATSAEAGRCAIPQRAPDKLTAHFLRRFAGTIFICGG